MVGNVARTLGALAGVIHITSAVPFGLQIYSCTMPGVIAPGFDDGPWIYSEDILDRMQAAGFKATWFINGANKGNIYDYNSTLRRMVTLGHQIGSHTWSHKDIATLTADGVKQEMVLLEEAMTNILGYFPYYMRPPFLSVNANSLQVLKDLEYHVIIGDLNTKDWEYQTEGGIETAKKLFTDGLDMGYSIVEAHEQEPWTHGVLIDYMIDVVRNRSIKTVTVAECLQDTQLYRSVREPRPTNATSSADPGPTVVYSLNGRCGNINAGNNTGWTCPPNGGRCCSKYGNCGSGPDYCAYNLCQPAFGLCSPAPSSTPYRDEASNSNTATILPSRTISATGVVSATITGSKAATSSLGPGSITPDGTCGNLGSGKDKGYICKTGQCCSKYGNCGTTSDYCAASVCQSAFGKCDAAPGRGSVTPDSTCGDIGKGGNNGYICKAGQCCSKYGNCGTTNDYCAASLGCQPAFGNCTGVVSSAAKSSAPIAPASNIVSASAQSSAVAAGTPNAALNPTASAQSSATFLSSGSTLSSSLTDAATSSLVVLSSTSLPDNAALRVAPSASLSVAPSSSSVSAIAPSLGSTTTDAGFGASISASISAQMPSSSSSAVSLISTTSVAPFISDPAANAVVASSPPAPDNTVASTRVDAQSSANPNLQVPSSSSFAATTTSSSQRVAIAGDAVASTTLQTSVAVTSTSAPFSSTAPQLSSNPGPGSTNNLQNVPVATSLSGLSSVVSLSTPTFSSNSTSFSTSPST